MGTLGQKLDYLTDTKSILKQKINNLGGSLTDESTFRSYGDYLDELYNEMPKVTGEGTEITLTPTRKGRMNIGLKGNTEQASYTGKNLLKIDTDFPSANKRGITNIYDSATGKNSFSGTATGDYPWISSAEINTIPQGTTLTFSMIKTLTYKVYARLYYDATNYETITIESGDLSATKTLQHDITRVVILLQILSGTTINEELYLQIEQGSTATDYEPYTGGQPSPNPDYPQPIYVVTGNNTVGVQGKNLFDKNDDIVIDKTLDDTDGSIIDSTGYWCTNYYIPVQPNTTYVASGNNNLMKAAYYDENKNFIYSDIIQTLTSTVSLSINPPSNCYYIRISNNGTPSKCQLEKGSTATDYVPYYYKDYPLNLGSLELCKIGDYQDYFYKENGNWYKHKAINKGNFNDIYRDKTVKVASYIKPGLVAYACSVLPIKKIGGNNFEVFCDNFSQKYLGSATDTTDTNSVRNSEGIASHTGNVDQLVISIDETRLSGTSVENFYSYITNLNPQIAYILNTATATQITDETLISQLDAIENAMSTTDTTTITQTNSDLPFIITASALKPFTTETLTTSLTDGE